jgi:hypothetical protein
MNRPGVSVSMVSILAAIAAIMIYRASTKNDALGITLGVIMIATAIAWIALLIHNMNKSKRLK